jgi:rod shape-determining protein MreC
MTARTSLWFVSMMGFGLLLLAASSIGILRPFQDVSYKALSPLETLMRGIARPIANTITHYNDIHDLTEENERLRTDNERLQADIARLQTEAQRREELERLLEVKQGLSNHEFLGATVIARDPTNLRQMVAIDRGKSDGIKAGMPVVTEGRALVGTITKVEGDHSWITLVTDVDSAVSASTLEADAKGVVSGGYNRKLTMEFVSQDAPVKEGDTVVTSGLGGSYPPGLVIGKVTGIAGSRQEVFRTVTVEPLASLARIDTLLVMTSFVPVRLATP